jgi:hypothetical protein
VWGNAPYRGEISAVMQTRQQAKHQSYCISRFYWVRFCPCRRYLRGRKSSLDERVPASRSGIQFIARCGTKSTVPCGKRERHLGKVPSVVCSICACLSSCTNRTGIEIVEGTKDRPRCRGFIIQEPKESDPAPLNTPGNNSVREQLGWSFALKFPQFTSWAIDFEEVRVGCLALLALLV